MSAETRGRTSMSAPIENVKSLGSTNSDVEFDVRFFVTSSAWENVRQRKRSIIIGRKGTGKTAIRRALEAEGAESSTIHTTSLSFSDYPWRAHYQITDDNAGARTRYKETWMFLLLVEMAKQLASKDRPRDTGRDTRKALRKVRRFLKRNWGGTTFNHKQTLANASTLVVRGELRPQALGFSLGGINWDRVSPSNLGPRLRQTNEWLLRAIQTLVLPSHEYFLVLDDLDMEFDPASNDYSDSMIGLLLAVDSFHKWSDQESSPTHAIAVLRDDIYDGLNFPDKNKITTRRVERIRWSAEEGTPDSLKNVLDRRIAFALGLPPTGGEMSLLFDDDLIRGKQTKYSHMVVRTYMRPRDLLQFANECIVAALDAGRLTSGTRIANEDVVKARPNYSNYLKNELADEIHAHHRDWELWLLILKRVGLMTFDLAGFNEARLALGDRAGSEPADEILRRLYAFGIIGYSKLGGQGRGGSGIQWSYQNSENQFDLDAKYFAVHPGLKENLELREERRRTGTPPSP